MKSTEPAPQKETKNYTPLKIIILILLIATAFFFVASFEKLQGGGLLSTFAPIYFRMLLFTLLLLAIGYIVWDLVGDPLSEIATSFLFSSGGKISKPQHYSKARALLAQNKLKC